MRYSTYIGIDTHSTKNEVCALVIETGEIQNETFSDDPNQIIRWINENDLPRPIRCVYEAGPTGYSLARTLISAGFECVVAATSKLPKRHDRKKNDKIDAEWLARLLSSGAIRETHIPTLQEESLQHLSRLRNETMNDLKRAKQRVASFLLLTKTEYSLTKRRWSKKFREWAEEIEFERPEDTFVFRLKYAEVIRLEERLSYIENHIVRIIEDDERLLTLAKRLMCIYGVGKVAAFTLVCEINDFARFKNGRSFASFVGLTPSEHSTGKRRITGRITKTGNGYLRSIIIECANIYARCIPVVRHEDESVPENVRAKADKCSKRLKKRREYLIEKGLSNNKAKVAIARELCEWVYWIATLPA
ncbi:MULTISPECIES: IS110 family transposase [unclassified Adlercreutzia]|uniref:IS110 family transposase n=1 Tax=unclassified Adlercreutzia TaxID=2636013 RepID=UPI0013E9DC77|nr:MULTISPECIES: IS110 family transposase [unclassified Adlercreutzia]